MAEVRKKSNFLNTVDDAIDALSRFISQKTLLALSTCVLFGLIFFSPGLFDIPPTDRDEARFAQASKQMIETENYSDIRIGEEARYQKPVGIYWIQTSFVRIAALVQGDAALYQIGNYRLASLFGGVFFIIGTYFLTRRLFGREAAFIAALMSSVCALVITEAHLAKTDSVLAAATVFSFYALACAWKSFSLDRPEYFKTKHFFIFWCALIIGALVKGINIIIILTAITSLSIYARNVSWLKVLRPVTGLALFLVFTAPWFYYISVKSGGAFAEASFHKDFSQKLFAGAESHGAPPFTHLLAHFVLFFPVALLTPYAVTVAFKNRLHESFVFCLLSVVPVWLLFEIAPTKLPHYTYPVYGLIFAAIGGAVVTLIARRAGGMIGKKTFLIAIIPYLIVSGFLTAALPLLALKIGSPASVFFTILCGLSGVVAVWNVLCLRRELYFSVLWGICLQSALIFPYVFGSVLPKARDIFPSAKLQEVVRSYGCDGEIYIAGFTEPSARFLLGTKLKTVSVKEAIARYALAKPCDIFIIAENQDRFQRAYPDLVANAVIGGVNVNGNKGEIFEIYKID